MEKEQLLQQLYNLKVLLDSSESEYGDWKNLKQLDENCYTEEEMKIYRQKRKEIRQQISDLEERIKEVISNE